MKTLIHFLLEMKIFPVYIALIFLLPLSSVSAQSPDSSGVYSIVTTPPAYPGGEKALFEFIQQNIKYPKEALEQKKEGSVQMRIIIDEHGEVSNARVMRGICPSLDEEALRVINSTNGKWESGKLADKAVKTYKYLKVKFTIDTSAMSPAIVTAPEPIKFIGGDSAFYTFIRKYIIVPEAVFIHPNLWGTVTVSVSFSSMNQITDVAVLKGPIKDLNNEAIRLIKLSQGKWIRTDPAKMGVPVSTIVSIPFNESMIDSNEYKKFHSENIIVTACNENPVFKRAYDNYLTEDYTVAMVDLDDCIGKKKNLDAALVIRAFCYLNTSNYPAACQDLMRLKTTTGMDSHVQDFYYRYCTGGNLDNGFNPHRLNH